MPTQAGPETEQKTSGTPQRVAPTSVSLGNDRVFYSVFAFIGVHSRFSGLPPRCVPFSGSVASPRLQERPSHFNVKRGCRNFRGFLESSSACMPSRLLRITCRIFTRTIKRRSRCTAWIRSNCFRDRSRCGSSGWWRPGPRCTGKN